ncbi:MAG: EAL domain-containing protein [Deltaproteobacteria bacterium]|nr:EAL domain-containing protein [Deltaproteobacteria bacterium]
MTRLDEQLEGLKSATIMIVDDDSTTVEVLEAFLEGEGYTELVTLTDSRRAVETLSAQGADVLLLDLQMPNVDGFEVLQQIRNDEKLRQLPVIMLSAATDAGTKLKALELGATDFLSKPVDPSELALRLRNTLGAKAYQDRLTYYDGVTGLANRLLFLERSDRALRRAATQQLRCGLLHIQLDGFNRINDTLGHQIGDGLLKAVAKRLSAIVRPNDLGEDARSAGARMLSRVGGDEFALFLPGLVTTVEAGEMAQRALESLMQPYRSKTRELVLVSRVGIAIFPDHGSQVETLLRHARMCNAKRSAANGYSVFDGRLAAESRKRFKFETDIRNAVARGEMVLHYQPKVDIRGGQITGVEALMRWQHPELGLIAPGEFIAIAEEMHIIDELGHWAIHEACRQAREWQDAGLPPIIVSVNVSSQQISNGIFLNTLRSALDESGLDPGFLLLELTEAELMGDPEGTVMILQKIAEMNLSISLDDFGTGHSALSYLKQFPVDELKIDRSFVQCLPDDTDTAAIVQAIIAMAHSLGLSIVAEGVETAEQLNLLRAIGCDEYQGHLFSKALPPAHVPPLLHQ